MSDEERKDVRVGCEKFIRKDSKLKDKFLPCNEADKEWVLDYLSLGKGVIPYEMIQRFYFLDISPEKGFFFCLIIFTLLKDYETVKNFCQTLNLDNLRQLKKLYNFEDTVILVEIFEQRCNHFQGLFKFNPTKCNSVSCLSGCVHEDKSKCLIALPTNASYILLFERTLIGGFSYVNTHLDFDSQILLPKVNRDKYKLTFFIEGQKKIYQQKF